MAMKLTQPTQVLLTSTKETVEGATAKASGKVRLWGPLANVC
jgi:hypothetical protein